jgi:diguanylate cyclase (GGDEF)-like protein
MKETQELLGAERISYDNYKLTSSLKYIRLMIQLVCIINLMLLIPDMILVGSVNGKILIAALRAVFSLTLLVVCFHIKKIKQFSTFSILITVFELFAILILLLVMSQYAKPNCLILTMGMVTIDIIVFFVPNQWKYMLVTTVFGSAGYFICAYALIEDINKIEFLPAVVYVSIAILFGAISSKSADRLQQSEFAAKSKLELLSSTDYLTETANRYKLTEEARRWIDFCHRQGFPLSVVFIDVDNLKAANDQYGHATGDIILAELARLISGQLRSSDTLARWGGDEFVLLLPNVPLDGTIALIERIRKTISNHLFPQESNVTCSFGIAGMEQVDDFNSLLFKADQMMYQSKEHGKNSVRWVGSNQD